jgi:hypothetical protein
MRRLNPAELEIDLLCKGVRIDPSCTLEKDARSFSRTRAGLGSGLEITLPAPDKSLWVNVPVFEPFAAQSPYLLLKSGGAYRVADGREAGLEYPVGVPPRPSWYDLQTSRGIPMTQVGVLQGTYLGIYFSETCQFWKMSPSEACKFCTTGLNVGTTDAEGKNLQDVVETAQAAKSQSGITFVHFNTGFQNSDGLDLAAPYVKAVKEKVGALVGLQVIPSKDLWKYDWLMDVGVDHFSFCYEFHNPEYFAKYLPGKQGRVGQTTFFRAMEYCAKKMGKGRASGEIIAGIEPIEDTLKAIDYITSVGCFPTVCIFRPLHGAALASHPSPAYEDMVVVFRHVYEACMKNGLPIGMAPNIEVSLIVNPDDAKYLAPPSLRKWLYEAKLKAVRQVLKPVFARKIKPRPVSASAERWQKAPTTA